MPWTEQDGLPFGGRTPLSRHTSWTGAQAAARRRGPKVQAYLRLLYHQGIQTDAGAAAALIGVVAGRSSICSIRNSLKAAGLVHGVDVVDGNAGAKNVRWGLTHAGRAAVAVLDREDRCAS